MRKLSFILLAAFVFSFFIACAGVSSASMLFDVDGDGNISAADARLALRASVQLMELTAKEKEAADIDEDGKVSAADARLILRKSIGYVDEIRKKTTTAEVVTQSPANTTKSDIGTTAASEMTTIPQSTTVPPVTEPAGDVETTTAEPVVETTTSKYGFIVTSFSVDSNEGDETQEAVITTEKADEPTAEISAENADKQQDYKGTEKNVENDTSTVISESIKEKKR